ncbi:hypothetical protein BDM02DRAFT_3109158 [Thelephora ganbajun]|uniref:Uncharacterized protein n=1 Tax=Thelephora ganbajun TaxID=370292 RepID=A0ACB6ZT49_THEGA|nr:hypothetical protein BDM02DRAFT_3109158 [Thelephora ganbajun]
MAPSSSSTTNEMHLPSPPPSDSSLSNSPSPKEEEDSNEFYNQLVSQLDPFTYLLQPDAMATDDLAHSPSVNEWSSFTSLAENSVLPSQSKLETMGFGEFNFAMPMDLGLESAFIDPSALHFNTSIFTQPDPPVHTFNLAQTEFIPPPLTQLLGQNGPHSGRRLSITSSSSSSGASLSPILERQPTPELTAPIPANSPEELAQKVLQAIGATLIVPSDASNLVAAQSRLHIPRFHKQAIGTPVPTAKSSTVSQPTPESSPSSSHLAITGPGRPKTGHTIIERRYRTNLNARITNLKQSVPALRVLEARLNGKDTSPNDTVDDRGFVDGVKVGRKMSKANILGKATEYIRVLKRREARLKREQAGLKSLISGLVNGPALLETWETQWREMFGGEEKDEVEDEPGSDDEDGEIEGEGEDDEEDLGRTRKKPRTVKAVKLTKAPSVLPATPKATTATTTSTVLPEKRKRGRPRKIPLPAPAPQAVTTIPMTANHTLQSPQQYLLATFAFLSFFNSPLATSTPYSYSHEHTGSVLNHTVVGKPASYGWNDLIQTFHLLVSVALFFSIAVPWLPHALRKSRFIARLASPFIAIYPAYGMTTVPATSSLPEGSQDVKQSSAGMDATRSILLNALSPSSRGSETEAQLLRKALGISAGLVGLCQGVSKAGKKHRGIELDQLEQRAWVRLGELVALDDNVSLSTRLLTYWGMSWHISTFSASAVDLTTLALIIRPFAGSRASYLWEQARRKEILRPHEKFVLNSMDVCEAAVLMQKWHRTDFKWEHHSPLAILAETLVRRKIKKHARLLFVQSVDKTLYQDDGSSDTDESMDGQYPSTAGTEAESEVERLQIIQAGKSLGGTTADLAIALEKVWDLGTCELSETSRSDVDYEDVRALLNAIALYRAVFRTPLVHAGATKCNTHSISVILTPPSSPSPKDVQAHQTLRKVLGASVFEMLPDADGDQELDSLAVAVENARDSVVDMLVDSRAASRRVHF